MRHPEYQPTFSAEDIEEIRKVCKQRKAPHVKVQRAQIALCLVEDPKMHSTEVAKRVGVHVETVRKWRKRWSLHGFSLEDLPRSGRPRRFSP